MRVGEAEWKEEGVEGIRKEKKECEKDVANPAKRLLCEK